MRADEAKENKVAVIKLKRRRNIGKMLKESGILVFVVAWVDRLMRLKMESIVSNSKSLRAHLTNLAKFGILPEQS